MSPQEKVKHNTMVFTGLLTKKDFDKLSTSIYLYSIRAAFIVTGR